MKSQTSSPRKDRRTIEQGTRKRGRVLLISDEPAPPEAEVLASAGLDVVGVSTGTGAVVSLRGSRPHLVIAGTRLKGTIRTSELARILTQAPDRTQLLLTGPDEATLERRLAAFAVGAFDYFQLPSEIPLLLERTKQLVTIAQTVEGLRADADLDPLTNLANRRRFRVALSREVERWRRYGVPCALLMLDIDHMKSVNDKFGHAAGDAVLRHVADTLIAASRANDTAARLGGEEFALLLAGVPDGKALQAAERLRSTISGSHVEGVGRVTVSIGLAACPEHANSERSLYSASDRALYEAKNARRNCVAVAVLLQEKLPGL